MVGVGVGIGIGIGSEGDEMGFWPGCFMNVRSETAKGGG